MPYNKIGTFEFLAEPFQADYTGHLTLSVLGNHLLNCAGIHAEQRGFGISKLNNNNSTWVLSRLVIQMNEMPLQYTKFRIETWVEAVNKLFTSRNFAIFGENNEPLGYVRSIWAMIDLSTRKPMNLLELHGPSSIAQYVLPERECPIDGPSRFKIKAETPVHTLSARYSDIDINGHFNSVRYIEHILDLFDLEIYKKSPLQRFEIAFVNESHFGDNLDFYLENSGNNQYSVEVKNAATADVICRSVLQFG